MIEDPPLLTIKKTLRRPSSAQIKAFEGVPSAVASDAMAGGSAMSSAVRHLDGGQRLPATAYGPALTVESGPADLYALLAALKFLQPGDMVVSAFGGYQKCAHIGDKMANFMKNSGAAGFVTDGPIRDLHDVLPVGLPIWCSGLAPATPFENGPGKIGLPILVDGLHIENGDMIIADLDGVTVVPFDQIDDVAAKSAEILRLESDLDVEVANGLKRPDIVDEWVAGDRVKWVD
ncbi:MAG: RraA family protein [Boseongicola sp.]|nr:RraA family protein [Boseongicola sp.]MDD9977236.1 RraA family protein [Boseongicola sp.]